MSVKDSVLETLLKNKGVYISGEELSNQLSVSRAAVWKGIRSLREDGYIIEAVTNKGYMMPESPGALTQDGIRRAMAPKYRENDIVFFDITDSTNDQAKRLLTERKVKHGTAFVARQQTGGKGRLGRSFFSPEDGLYISVVVNPKFDMSKSTLVTVAAAVAVAEGIDSAMKEAGKSCRAQIKWVNDVYLNKLKVCGILTEAVTDFESGQIESLVIGMGVNTSLKGFPEKLLETAGAVEGDYSKAALAANIISNVLDYVSEIEAYDQSPENLPVFIRKYKDKSLLTGKTIKVYKGVYRSDPTKELGGVSARVLGIDDHGGLQVLYANGEQETLTSGEVSIRL